MRRSIWMLLKEIILKSLLLYSCTLVLLPLVSWAEPQSISEKIYSPDYMSATYETSDKVTLTSPYANNPLLTDKKRSIVQIKTLDHLTDLSAPLRKSIKSVLLKKKKRALTQKDMNSHYIFANFVHDHTLNPDETSFYIAIIPRNTKVTHLYYQIEWFGAGVGAHNQLRFKLDQPIAIIPQEFEDAPIVNHIEGDLIYSLQAIRTEGGEQDWDPFKGIMGEYANALQFYSTSSKAKDQIKRSVVESFLIKKLTNAKQKMVFEQTLKTSDRSQEEEIYNTVFNSCVTHTLTALSKAIPRIEASHFNPYSALKMIDQATDKNYQRVLTLNQEFKNLVHKEEIMTMKEISSTSTSQRVSKFLPLIQTPEFDQMIRAITLFIIQNQLSYPQVKTALMKVKKGSSLKKAAMDPETKKLMKMIIHTWNQSFPNQPIENFFIALETMKTQDI